ncbi:MAG: hypothetical protein ACKO96_30370, partial [Flammeovirgaceae bacterium]
SKTYPVVFVAAEGGALRTGFFTALALAKIDSMSNKIGSRIFAFSGVSGGALGVNCFSTLKAAVNDSLPDKTKRFFGYDFLSAATGRLMQWPCQMMTLAKEENNSRSLQTLDGPLQPKGSRNQKTF